MDQGIDSNKNYRAGDCPAHRSNLGITLVLALLLAAGLPGLASANVAGKVDFSAGNTTVVHANGDRESLLKGMTVSEGDTIETGVRGLAQIRFTDGSYVSIQRNSTFRIDEYAYEPDQGALEKVVKKVNKGLFSLLEGGFRTITGFLGAEETYSVKTPVATIGIRGTEYLAELGRSLTIRVARGALEICNEAGCHFFRTDEAGFVKDAKSLIKRLRDLGLDIIISTENDETIASIEGDDSFRFKIAEEVDDSGESTLIADEIAAQFTPITCDNSNCVIAFGFAQSSFYNIIHTTDTNATFNNSNVMTSHDGGQEWIADAVGTTTAMSAGANANMSWGRWDRGLTQASLDALHYIAGIPTPNLANLSGTYTFNVIGFTNPTVVDDSDLGSFQRVAGSFDANFNTSRVLLDFKVKFDNANYNFSTGVSPIAIDNTFSTFTGIADVSGGPRVGAGGLPTCQDTGCNGAVTGLFAGSQAANAGLSYHVQDPGSALDIIGVVAFDRQ